MKRLRNRSHGLNPFYVGERAACHTQGCASLGFTGYDAGSV
jgi:hypothetical protein